MSDTEYLEGSPDILTLENLKEARGYHNNEAWNNGDRRHEMYALAVIGIDVLIEKLEKDIETDDED